MFLIFVFLTNFYNCLALKIAYHCCHVLTYFCMMFHAIITGYYIPYMTKLYVKKIYD